MKTYVIEKGIPMPAPRSGGWTRRNVFPLDKMQPGDMFKFSERDYQRLQSAVQSYRALRPDARFAVRRYGAGFGVWCLANQPYAPKKKGPKPGTPRPPRREEVPTFFDQPKISARTLARRARMIERGMNLAAEK